MKALILCAGYGTRLRPITNSLPKCLVNVAGKPVLQYLVEYLNSYGIVEIFANLHFRPLKIMRRFGTRLVYSFEPELLGAEKTVEGLRKWLGDNFVVMNGDTLTNMNLYRMSELHFRARVSVTAYKEGEVNAGTWIYSNFGNKLTASYQEPDAFWFDVGTPEGLKKANDYFIKEKITNLSRLRSKGD